ncbi:hypothetical protein LIER_39659 [Lithospermum erythrorhizon]|uniref:Aminotransferase-like plant mobile domain-containing protein n=1 Tax=Lithospermum erythrorhizon TaxID=34254 RepID=A0AAV3QKJ7_LITER
MTGAQRASDYLLYLLGCVLFVDKTQMRVPQLYLRITHNLEQVPKLSWGTATLVYLYYQFGKASRVNVKQLVWCMALLEVGYMSISQHFIHAIKPAWVEGSPRASRWENLTTSANSLEELIKYRQILDNMTPEDVTLSPYGD